MENKLYKKKLASFYPQKKFRHQWRFWTMDATRPNGLAPMYWLTCDRKHCHACAWVTEENVLREIQWCETDEMWEHKEKQVLRNVLTGILTP